MPEVLDQPKGGRRVALKNNHRNGSHGEKGDSVSAEGICIKS